MRQLKRQKFDKKTMARMFEISGNTIQMWIFFVVSQKLSNNWEEREQECI